MDFYDTNGPTYQGQYSLRQTANSDELRLKIIMDSQAPKTIIVPAVPQASNLTLGEFKTLTSLTQDHYKFYFKSQDSEFGMVKEELVDDNAILPVEEGEIVAWVITNDRVQSTLFEPEQLSEMDEVDNYVTDHRHNMGQGMPNGAIYGARDTGYPKRWNHSQSCITVNLFLESHTSLGLTVLCPSDEINKASGGIPIDKVQANSVASNNGEIAAGDRIVEINGYDLRDLSTSEAITIFKQFVDRKGAINLVLQKTTSKIYDYRPVKDSDLSYPAYHHHQHRLPSNKSTNGFDPATELPSPVLDPDPPPPIPKTNRILPKVKCHRTACSLPRSMTPRSLYTTGNFDDLTSGSDFQYPLDSRSVYESTTPNSMRQISIALHCGKDDIFSIYSTLKSDANSLDIRDRDWLKVVVKDAFLGSSLVKWLSRNVYGFCNRSEIKRFANQMLSLNLIKSPMSNSTFSEKCYYTLS